jgi:hypothetical protein
MNYNNIVMQLRKICNHPYLVLEELHPIDDSLYFEDLIISSGKLAMLEKLLMTLLPKGHKCLIFSQMTSALDIIESLLSTMGIGFARLDGRVGKVDRDQQIALFNAFTSAAQAQAQAQARARGGHDVEGGESGDSHDLNESSEDPCPGNEKTTTAAAAAAVTHFYSLPLYL